MRIILKCNWAEWTFMRFQRRFLWLQKLNRFLIINNMFSVDHPIPKTLIDLLLYWFFIALNRSEIIFMKNVTRFLWLIFIIPFNFKLICKSKSLSFQLWIHLFFFNLSLWFILYVLFFCLNLLNILSLMRILFKSINA